MKKIIFHDKLKIITNKKITDNIYNLKFSSEKLNDVKAGQFIFIDCVTSLDRNNCLWGPTLLKRPFSFYLINNEKKEYEILYRIKQYGTGTNCLTNLKSNDEINFLGPLGKPIDFNELDKSKKIYLIAGGMGIAPITFLAQSLKLSGYDIEVIFGNKIYDDFTKFCINKLTDIIKSYEIHIAIDINNNDCNSFVGNVLDLIKCKYYNLIPGPSFVCGPEPMMKEIHNLSKETIHSCYVFLERRMACGMGVCNSCDCNGKKVCTDGPCIKSNEVFD